jgi:transcriptional regulator with XRE-family HTH domain
MRKGTQMDTTADLINEVLERERRTRRITWKQLADELGVHQVTLWKWRHGRELGPAAALLPLTLKHYGREQAPPDTKHEHGV